MKINFYDDKTLSRMTDRVLIYHIRNLQHILRMTRSYITRLNRELLRRQLDHLLNDK